MLGSRNAPLSCRVLHHPHMQGASLFFAQTTSTADTIQRTLAIRELKWFIISSVEFPLTP
jgi:malonyl CoA-acyl carrier protein transacylase